MLMLLHLGGRSARTTYPVARAARAGTVAAAAAGVAAIVRRLRRVEVVGESMRPLLEPGDRLIVVRTADVRPGDVVAVTDPRAHDRIVIKRVAACSPTHLTVLGDNPAASTDSRTFGPVGRDALHGRAVYRYYPPHRRARLGR